MIITVPCTHPYFLEFMEKEAGIKLSSDFYPDENGLPMAFLCMRDNQVVGTAMLVSAELSAQINEGHVHDDSPWLMGLFVKESERKKRCAKEIMEGIIHYCNNRFHEIHFNTESAQEFYQKHWKLDSMGSDIINTPEGELKTDYFRMNIERNYYDDAPSVMNLNELFFYLCERDEIEQLDKLLACSEININSTNNYDYNYNGLIIAARRGNLEMIQYLIGKGVNIHQGNSNQTNALMYACLSGHDDIVDYLLSSSDLKEHARINDVDDKGWNALLYACEGKHYEIAKKLIIEYNISITADTLLLLEQKQEHDVIALIKTRDVYENIQNQLSHNTLLSPKKKI